MKLNGGPDGKSRIQLNAANTPTNPQDPLPLGLADGLGASSNAVLQVLSSDAACFEMEVDEIKKQEPGLFKAIRK